MEIVKFGGSLCRPDALAAALDWLEARVRAVETVVVCGGGAGADLVRSEQRRLGFDALTAHRQALLAMEQTAWWLQSVWQARHGRLCPVSGEVRPGTLWTPRTLVEDPQDVELSWEVSSDSISAWLAGRHAATHLWLLKSIDVACAAGTPEAWAARGWVDARFPDHARRAGCPVTLLGQAGWSSAARIA